MVQQDCVRAFPRWSSYTLNGAINGILKSPLRVLLTCTSVPYCNHHCSHLEKVWSGLKDSLYTRKTVNEILAHYSCSTGNHRGTWRTEELWRESDFSSQPCRLSQQRTEICETNKLTYPVICSSLASLTREYSVYLPSLALPACSAHHNAA